MTTQQIILSLCITVLISAAVVGALIFLFPNVHVFVYMFFAISVGLFTYREFEKRYDKKSK